MGLRPRQPVNGQGLLFACPIQQSEHEIRAEIEVVLRGRGIVVARTDAKAALGADGRWGFRVTPGWPDLTAVLPGGRFWGIECKRFGQKLRPEQEKVRAEIESAGGLYTIATGVADVLAVLESRAV